MRPPEVAGRKTLAVGCKTLEPDWPNTSLRLEIEAAQSTSQGQRRTEENRCPVQEHHPIPGKRVRDS